jgi:hypothetical protein
MVVAWLLLTVIYAAVYVQQSLQLPGLEGYEKDWKFQLLAFGYARLPWLVLVLVAGLVRSVFCANAEIASSPSRETTLGS